MNTVVKTCLKGSQAAEEEQNIQNIIKKTSARKSSRQHQGSDSGKVLPKKLSKCLRHISRKGGKQAQQCQNDVYVNIRTA